MKNKAFRFASLGFVLAASLLMTCDPFHEDAIPLDKQTVFNPPQLVYYALPNSSVVIDLQSIVKSSFTSLSVVISLDPEKGDLSTMSDLILKYKPRPDFLDGQDRFAYAVNSSNGTNIRTDTVYIIVGRDQTEFPCGLFAVEDFVSVKPGANISISFLDNDRICGVDIKDLKKSIYSEPQHGTATFSDDLISYTSHAGYAGWDQFVYKINFDTGDSVKSSLGLVSILVNQEPCGFGPVDDSLYYKTTYTNPNNPPPNEIEVDVLANDLFCSINSSDVAASVVRGPFSGTASPMENGKIRYETPVIAINMDFICKDSIIYQVCYKGTCKEAVLRIFIKSKWTSLQLPALRTFTSAWFADENIGYIGSTIDIYKTIDGGEHWKQLITPDLLNSWGLFFFDVNDLFFLDADNGWAVGSKGLLKTNNGGESWSYTNGPFDEGSSVFFTSSATGFVSGALSPGTIYKTSDGGTSWHLTNIQAPANTFDVFDIEFINSNTGYARTPKHIIKTVDGGENWFISFTPGPENDMLSLANAGTGVCAIWTGLAPWWIPPPSSGSIINKSEDGINWTPSPPFFSTPLAWGSSFAQSDDLAFAYGAIHGAPQIYISNDDGSTWRIDEVLRDGNLHDRVVFAAAVPSNEVAYLVGNQIILKYDSR